MMGAYIANGFPVSLPTGGQSGDSRLVVLSNRAPVRVIAEDGAQRIEPTVGGLGATFMRLLERRGGLWIAWAGSNKTPAPLMLPADDPRFTMVFPALGEREISNYYYGMCNCGLWPLMHLMTQNCRFRASYWGSYRHVNQLFAQLASTQCRPSDQVWIQDFHLALVPSLLRQRRPELPIGLFWHVPFPPETIFRIFPWRRELLEGMLGADLIGFHIDAYADHFLDCCEAIAGLAVDRRRREVNYQGREVRVGPFPLGVPAEHFATLATSPKVQARAAKIRAGLGTPHVILGVDRLDYTKGLLERMRGFERFLEVCPEYRRRVTFVQIAVPSRTRMDEYVELKRQLDEAIGRTLGRFSSEGWVPIRYYYDQFDIEELTAFYSAADIALVTPLRDGMNLVAKEYVAARVGEDGMLVLSEFAGAAQELREALVVNPYDVEAIAAALRQGLGMEPGERQERMRALRARVSANDLDSWAQGYLRLLAAARPAPNRYAAAN